MQEESGESVCRDSSVLVWPCPLCQQERPDRDALAQHLTERHSVLPACLDRLLDTATPTKAMSGNKVDKADTQNDSDTPPSQQMPSESNGAPSDLSENNPNTAEPKQSMASVCTLRRPGVRVDSPPEEEIQGKGERMQEGDRDYLEPAQAVSAFLTLLTSSGSPSLSSSLFTASAGSTPGVATTQLELIAQQQLLLPLFLNGLQTQNQGANLESASAVLTQSVPLLGLSAAQQALLAQRLSTVQNQGLGLLTAGLPEATRTCTVEKEKGETSVGVEGVKKETEVKKEEEKDREKQEEDGPLKLKFEAVQSGIMKGVAVKKELSEKGDWQEGVPELNCTLKSEKNQEVGLSGQQVRRWLEEARKEPRERPKGVRSKAAPKEAEGGGVIQEDELEDGVLTIVETEGGESPAISGRHAIDLSHGRGRGREPEQGKESPGEPCLTSDSDNEGDGFYTSLIVTDEESQSGPAREGPGSPAREEVSREQEEEGKGGKVLRSSTVFLSDAEDTEDEEEGEGGTQRVRKRKRNRELEREEVEVKKERQDPDVDLELEAQADPPVSFSVDQQGLPSITAGGILHPLPLSISLTPFATQFINPYVLSIPPSAIGLGIAEGDRDRGRTRCSAAFPDPHGTPPPASHVSPIQSLSNGGICESALDLSMGKKHSSASTSSFSASTGDRAVVQGNPKPEGLGLRSTALGIPGAGGLIVVRVKPDTALAIPAPNNSVGSNNNARTSTVYIRAAERVSASLMEREREKQQERERERQREREREKEREKEQKPTKTRRFRDMRRSRTIIQTEQLDVLYGCYFKDPNPGKHEFQRISEWVHLPKKVVQIWFQNMRARERKGEVRFISDGTLAAMGKPLIKFTWPLTLPIFSSSPSPNSSPLSSSGTTGDSAGASPKAVPPKRRPEVEQGKEKEDGRPKDSSASGSSSFSNLSAGISRMTKPKPETQSPGAPAKTASKAMATAPEVPVVIMKTRFPPPSPHSTQKRKRGGGEEEKMADEEDEQHSREKVGPGVTNRMLPKTSPTPSNKPLTPGSHKRNGLNDWSPKGSFKINTLSREQLGLSPPRHSAASTLSSNASVAKSSPQEGAYQHHSSSPRRPRTHLTSLQVSIMQSCYETCPHPNALECETIGTELGLPLKVVQIWFQNTRAKEKRWRLQQQKQSPGTTDCSKKVDTSSGSFLLYSALRANRPILPKPVQLTVLEPSTPPASGQPASRETLRGRCDACGIGFESRAAGRTHVFSPRHLATLRSTNFGHPPSLVNSGSGTGSSSGSGVATQSSPNPASSTS
ncbi:hypothetical protein AAFF_G00292550 [Aldrovandia affinis]|uniref:Homeobox domain-containing protein n=1 Tax=Aldrovandia affinis TaxID=143900 RepID=A0AAD7WSQ9_9TELE|nr:hypothetical protein AAFF_G00292550 [Aldrovandia affinis]